MLKPAARTAIIGLGTLDSNSGTGLGGGASGTDSLDDFSIEDPAAHPASPAETAVTEGSSVTFTVTANRVPSSDLMIDLTIADAAAGDYLDSGDEGDNMVTLSGTTTATVEIPHTGRQHRRDQRHHHGNHSGRHRLHRRPAVLGHGRGDRRRRHRSDPDRHGRAISVRVLPATLPSP